MRTLWRILVRTVFWSFERGTWPYDVAVALIVVFVLLSPRSWFHDRPPVMPPANPAMVQLHSADTAGSMLTYRVDAHLLDSSPDAPGPELEHQLHEAVRKNVPALPRNDFQIVRIEPVHGNGGSVDYYDVSIKP